ncbi:MAG TPA: TetR/AcrR family transcriptional regulator [Chthonomonadaceae bacterium]|nr:TetR/AcrR family transcriptional regulator [Chthonomonadaceae bacterium]
MRRGAIQKSEATRERIYASALELFAEKGFAAATMREIAGRAGCSLGLAYHYFPSKDGIALALYERLLDEFVAAAAEISPGPVAARWSAAMSADLARMAPHRAALVGLISAGLAPGSPTQVLGAEAAPIRRRMIAAFTAVVSGARDVPRAIAAGDLAVLLYALHLLIIFFWLQDPSPGQRTTVALVDFGRENLRRLGLAARLPGFAGAVRRLASLLGPVLAGEATSVESQP